jgi:tetratricopeptide (TPR) repeat protein
MTRKMVSTLAVATVLAIAPVKADDSARLYQLQNSPVVSMEDAAAETSLSQRVANLKAGLKQKGLSKDEKKAMKAELKAASKELKAVQKRNKKARKSHAAEIKKLQKSLKRQYGMGPYPYETQQFVAARPEALAPFYRALFVEGERNATLNFNRLGLAAMELGYYDHAEWAFDRALDRIEMIYADNPQAKAAKSKFKAEKVKEFKGEPYERAMSYYYRGLLYLKAGDFENARAVFRAGEYQDTVSEEEEFQSDFAVLNYLNGWSLKCQGRDGSEEFMRAMKVRDALAMPGDDHNTLYIAEVGAAPQKYGDGQYKEVLKFRPDQRFGETSATFAAVDQAGTESLVATNMATDLAWQSTTRGGRAIDGILEGKAQFKETTGAVGNTLQTGGQVAMLAGLAGGDSDAAMIGAGVALVGGLFKGLSASAKPEADTRMWENLPGAINVATDATPVQGELSYQARYTGAEGTDVAEPTGALLVGGNEQCGIVWTRSRSAAGVAESSPGARYTWKQVRKQKDDIQEKDMIFRNWLTAEAPGVSG